MTDIDSLRAELARQTAIAVDHCERADAAERMVAELRGAAEKARPSMGDLVGMGEHERVLESENADHARTIEACSRAAEQRDAMRAERDAAIAARDEAEASLDVYEQRIREIAYDVFGVIDGASVVLLDAIGRQCHRERIERVAAERARDEVGIQLAAAQAEIARMRRAMVDVRALRAVGVMPDRVARALDEVFARLDAVPGDALAPVARGAPFDEAGTVNPDKLASALEASGIDTDNVKGLE